MKTYEKPAIEVLEMYLEQSVLVDSDTEELEYTDEDVDTSPR